MPTSSQRPLPFTVARILAAVAIAAASVAFLRVFDNLHEVGMVLLVVLLPIAAGILLSGIPGAKWGSYAAGVLFAAVLFGCWVFLPAGIVVLIVLVRASWIIPVGGQPPVGEPAERPLQFTMGRLLWATTLCCAAAGSGRFLLSSPHSETSAVAVAILFGMCLGTLGAAAGALTNGVRGALVGFVVGSLPGLLFLALMSVWVWEHWFLR